MAGTLNSGRSYLTTTVLTLQSTYSGFLYLNLLTCRMGKDPKLQVFLNLQMIALCFPLRLWAIFKNLQKVQITSENSIELPQIYIFPIFYTKCLIEKYCVIVQNSQKQGLLCCTHKIFCVLRRIFRSRPKQCDWACEQLFLETGNSHQLQEFCPVSRKCIDATIDSLNNATFFDAHFNCSTSNFSPQGLMLFFKQTMW